jgi:hypothetical protein
VKRLLDGTADDCGAVLVSFGSMADTRKMPPLLRAAFFNAFAHFPCFQFIWKFNRNESDPDETALLQQTPNMHPVQWVEQKAILGGLKIHCENILNNFNIFFPFFEIFFSETNKYFFFALRKCPI